MEILQFMLDFTNASLLGFSGSRAPSVASVRVLRSVLAALPAATAVVVGCATGVDSVVLVRLSFAWLALVVGPWRRGRWHVCGRWRRRAGCGFHFLMLLARRACVHRRLRRRVLRAMVRGRGRRWRWRWGWVRGVVSSCRLAWRFRGAGRWCRWRRAGLFPFQARRNHRSLQNKCSKYLYLL